MCPSLSMHHCAVTVRDRVGFSGISATETFVWHQLLLIPNSGRYHSGGLTWLWFTSPVAPYVGPTFKLRILDARMFKIGRSLISVDE